MKRNLRMALSMLLVLALLAGCGASKEPTQEAETSATQEGAESTTEEVKESTSEDPFAEKVEITIAGYYNTDVFVPENSYAELLLEDAFNMDITAVNGIKGDNYAPMIASGEFFEVNALTTWCLGNDLAKMTDLVNQGVLREFPEEWLWEYYPTGMKYLQENISEEFFANGSHMSSEGNVFFVPWETNGVLHSTGILYRADWLENLGMKEPTTLEEYEEMLRAFTYDDPDGNGKDDTYGMSGYMCGEGPDLRVLYAAFGAFGGKNTDAFELDDAGNVYYGASTESYKSGLTLLKDWYDKGYIDPEFMTDSRDENFAKWANSQVGTLYEWGGLLWSSFNFRGIELVQDNYGEGSVGFIDGLTTEYGDGIVHFFRDAALAHVSNAIVFTADTTDEQIIRYLQMCEGLSTDMELAMAVKYGEENVDYTLGEDGTIMISANVNDESNASKGVGETFLGQAVNNELFNKTFNEQDKMVNEIFGKIPQVNSSVLSQPSFPVPGVNEAYNQYKSEVDKVTKGYFTNVILGNSNLEGDWDAYQENLSKAGLDKIIEGYEVILN